MTGDQFIQLLKVILFNVGSQYILCMLSPSVHSLLRTFKAKATQIEEKFKQV
jgi:hypothetical protein